MSDRSTGQEVGRRALPIRLRAILLGLLLIPVNCYWVIIAEIRWYSLDGTCLPLFIQPLFMLFCLALLNLPLRRVRPALAFTPAELIVVYIMLGVSSTMAGHDTLQNLFGSITYPLWQPHANTTLNYQALFYQYLPKWLLVWDLEALQAFNEGNAWWLTPEYVRAWAMPLAAWAGFVLLMLLALFSMNVLVRKPWTDQEKLSFPIVRLPLAMVQQRTFFRSRLMWFGFAAAFLLRLFAGLHRLYPSLPYAKINYAEVMFTPVTPPLNAVGPLPFSFYPFMVGIVYFIPLDLSFSCWFFYLFRYLQKLVAVLLGWGGLRDVPYNYEQAMGAWIGLGIVLAWALRRHLGQALLVAVKGRSELDATEPVSYRWAFIGAAVGLVGMGVYYMLAGMSLAVSLAFTAMWILVSLTIARVRAEFGAPHEVFVNPSLHLPAIVGTTVLGPRNLTGLATMYWFNRCYRNHPMPNQLEAMRMSESTGVLRRLGWVLLIASILSIAASYAAQLFEGYRDGVSAKALGFKDWVGAESWQGLANRLQFGEPVQDERRFAMLAGLVVAFILRALRDRYVGWPFHPAGYALGMSFALDYFWFPFFMGWLVKLLLTRYGGIAVQRRAAPFFLGLILGDYSMGCLWAIYGPAKGIFAYKIFIG